MSVVIQIEGISEEVRDAIARRAAARGQSTQKYLRALLEREFLAARNRQLIESLIGRRSLTMDAESVVVEVRSGRETGE